jgi:hypothetical protein
MYVALENKDAVFDTDERSEVARIPASQAPRAIRLTAAKGNGKRGTLVAHVRWSMDLLEV